MSLELGAASKHPGVFIASEPKSLAAKILIPESTSETEVTRDSVITRKAAKRKKEEFLPPIESHRGGGEEEIEDEEDSSAESTSSEASALRAKKPPSRRAKPLKRRKKTLAKGKGRRWIFKKTAIKAPTAVARAVTSDRVFYKGQYFTKGDIVSVTDIDGGIYYGQLRGFLTDQYCEKSAVMSWLLPSVHSPKPEEGFDPATYVIGPEEELPRKLSCFTFVMHSPDDYFYYRNAPYPTDKIETDQEYIVTRQGPRIRLVKDDKVYFKEI